VLRKQQELAPYIEQALARKTFMRPLSDDEIPELHALGRQIVTQLPELGQTSAGSASGLPIPLTDPLEGSR
jgi:hypothetical protein